MFLSLLVTEISACLKHLSAPLALRNRKDAVWLVPASKKSPASKGKRPFGKEFARLVLNESVRDLL